MKNQLKGLLAGLLLAGVIGCGNSGVDNSPMGQQGNVGPNTQPTVSPTPSPTTTPSTESNLRIINPLGGMNNLVVSIDGAQVDGDLDGFESTSYIELDAGQHQVTVVGGQETLLDEQVTTTDGQFASFIIIPDSSLLERNSGVLAQGAPIEVDSLFVTDDATPEAGVLNARLVHANNITNRVQLENQTGELLLGPVSPGAATAYSDIAVEDIQTSNALYIQGLSAGGADVFLEDFDQIEGTGNTIAQEFISEFGTTGANLTILYGPGPSTNNFLMIVADVASEGDQVIISEED